MHPKQIPLNLTDEKQPYTYDEALKEAGFGRAQISLTILCGFCLMASANESMGVGIILPASQCDLELDLSRKGLVGGAVFLGVMISTYYWGYQTDIQGRHAVLRKTLLAATSCSLVACFVNNFHLLLALRFLVGLFIAAPGSTGIVYLGEFCPAKYRGQMISYACAIAGFGFFYVAAMAWWILSYDWSISITNNFTIRPWRLLFVVNALPGFISGLLLCFYPETPRFLLEQGRCDEALDVFRWIHRHNKGADSPFEVHSLKSESHPPEVPNQQPALLQKLRNQITPLMKFPHSISLLVCSFQTVSVYGTYGGLGIWYPQIMNLVFSTQGPTESAICSIIQLNRTSTTTMDPADSSTCDDTIRPETYIYTLILGALVGTYTLLISILLSRFGEKTLIYANLIAAGGVGVILQYVTHTYVAAILFCVEITVAAVSIILVRSMQVSLFPTRVKGTAVSLTALIGRVGQLISNVVTGVLIVQHCTLTLYFIASLLFISAALNALLQQ
ncbi:synaptic vesicle glycoprotein 2B-like [Sabethes cyaneus]|uniref:synaptic vesicle glycoprotein 2B-like n=1 Tax=Sabethes cyaneus TaxID=53552 RepID=UPI00237EE7CC|nr:synaptic vesicle glycoprotein 2B-like [Sabethes cyaneus]